MEGGGASIPSPLHPHWRQMSFPPLTSNVRRADFKSPAPGLLIHQDGLLPRALRIKRNCRGGGCLERSKPGLGVLSWPCEGLLWDVPASPRLLRSWERHSPGQVQSSSDTSLCVTCLMSWATDMGVFSSQGLRRIGWKIPDGKTSHQLGTSKGLCRFKKQTLSFSQA